MRVCFLVVGSETKRAHSLHHAAEVDPDAQRGDVTEEGGSGGRSGVVALHSILSIHVVKKKKRFK